MSNDYLAAAKGEVSSFFNALAKRFPIYDDAQMLVGSGESSANLKRIVIYRKPFRQRVKEG